MKSIQKHMLKKDNGVANVVVMMLILSVIVIGFAVIVAVYLPSLKETAELQHSEDVREAFLQFSSDVDAVYTRGQTGVYSQTFTLGGGDIQFSTSKSAGTVEIGTVPLKPDSLVNISYTNKTPIFLNKTRDERNSTNVPDTVYLYQNLTAITLNYTPVLSFWEDQGYNYSKGVVWVSKNDESTPVSSRLYNRTDGEVEQNLTVLRWLNSFAPAFVKTNLTLLRENTSDPDQITGYDDYYVYSLTLVNFTADPNKNYLSGNGDAELRITAEWESETEYVLDRTKIPEIGNIGLQTGKNSTRLLVTTINAKVSVS